MWKDRNARGITERKKWPSDLPIRTEDLLLTGRILFEFWATSFFFMRKKGSKTKKDEKGRDREWRLRVANPKVYFFWDFVRLEPSGTWSPRSRQSNASAGYTTRPSSSHGSGWMDFESDYVKRHIYCRQHLTSYRTHSMYGLSVFSTSLGDPTTANHPTPRWHLEIYIYIYISQIRGTKMFESLEWEAWGITERRLIF